MGKLHELLAVESDLENGYKAIAGETLNTFSKKANLFVGLVKRLENYKEGEPEAPEERAEMATTVHERLDYTAKSAIKYIDAVLQKETTNQLASADLIVNGVTLAEKLPATFLLGLESKLKFLRAMYAEIPTLPNSIAWQLDAAMGAGVYRAVHPERKFKTAKTFKHKVLYEATDHHPAQIEKWEENENVGVYITERWCGMITSADKSKLLGRLDALLQAVKKARQRANTVEVVKTSVGQKLFDYIHNDV